MLCICGSKIESKNCCSQFVSNNAIAQTPVTLMRSRYFAFAHSATDYLVSSHAQSTRTSALAQELVDWCAVTQWAKLVVHSFDEQNLSDSLEKNCFTDTQEQLPTVCFSAYYFYQNEFYVMKELSRFIVEQGQWRYLDGESLEHINFGKIGLNKPCPCNSGNKFKRCCYKAR